MNKPYAWVIIPELVVEDVDKLANIQDLIDELRDWGFDPKENIETNDRGRGGEGEDDDPIVPNNETGGLKGQIIENFDHRFEEDRIVSLSFLEFDQEGVNKGKKGLNNGFDLDIID